MSDVFYALTILVVVIFLFYPPNAEAAPIRLNGSPSGTLLPGTDSVRFLLSTDVASSCRYSSFLGTPYDDMKGEFASTSRGREHEALVRPIKEGVTFQYAVRCRDAVGDANTDDYIISFSVFAATVATTDTIIPAVPQLLAAQASRTSAELSWVASRDNIGIGKYALYRCEGIACVPNERIAETVNTNYRDDFLRANTPYHYQVTAIDIERNQSERSRVAHATTTEAGSPNVSTAINATSTQETFTIEAQQQYLRGLLAQLVILVQKLQEALARLVVSR